MIWEVKFYKNHFDWENIYEFQMFTDHKNYDLLATLLIRLDFFPKINIPSLLAENTVLCLTRDFDQILSILF